MFFTPTGDSITLHYQPLAQCTGKILSFEALMRWHHQRRGVISPEAFIPIFERSGEIVSLAHWGLKQACLDAASWVRPLGVSFNLSAILFQQEDLQDQIASILAETDLEPWRLELEVTEAALATDPDRALATLAGLSAMGICITLDDFGTGSSLHHLARFPFSKIKIDRNFVRNIEASTTAKSLVHMIVAFGHSLHLTVVGKGVETKGQLAYLREQGCDLVQGFLVGRPAEVTTFAALTGNSAADMRSALTDRQAAVAAYARQPPVQNGRLRHTSG